MPFSRFVLRVEEAVFEDSIKLTRIALPGINASAQRAKHALVQMLPRLKKVCSGTISFYTKCAGQALARSGAVDYDESNDSAYIPSGRTAILGVLLAARGLKSRETPHQPPLNANPWASALLDFNQKNTDSTRLRRDRVRASRRQSWRVWTLLVALGLVVLAMRQLNQPETAEKLGHLFHATDLDATTTHEPTQPESVAAQPRRPPVQTLSDGEATQVETSRLSDEQPEQTNEALAGIRDNTYFRPAESSAWFGMFETLKQQDLKQLQGASLGEITYAQLLKQPDVYRGKAVTVHGIVRREELENAPDNESAISAYHRLWIEPVGGSHWPIVVYALKLPEEFPRGDKLNASVAVTGYFFKNWSYPWRDGLGIAPVVLANEIEWKQNTFQPSRNRVAITGRLWIQGALIASAVAAIVVVSVLRTTRRPRRTDLLPSDVQLPDSETPMESVHQELAKLSESEGSR